MRLKDVTLTVRNLERSVAFYERAIGLERVTTDEAPAIGRATLGRQGRVLLTLIEQPRAAPRSDTAGLFHVAYLLADRRHLGAALARLGRTGVALTGAADHKVSEAIYLDDPDGHGIELYADRPAATWYEDGRIVMVNSRLDLGGLLADAEAAGIVPEASAEGMTLGHVHLEAVDLLASSDFALAELGLELQAAWPNAHFFAWDGYHHHLAYNDWNGRRTPIEPAIERIGLVEVGLAGDAARRTADPNGIAFRVDAAA